MRRLSLRKKIIILLVVICLFFVVLMGFVTFSYFNNILIDQKVKDISGLSVEQSNEFAQILKNEQLFAKMISQQTEVEEFLSNQSKANSDKLLKIFSKYSSEDKKYLAIYLLNTDGTGLVSTDSRFVGQNYSFRDYLKKAVDGQASVDVFVGVTSEQFGYYFANPVFNDQNKVIGVLVVKIDPNSINSYISNNKLANENSVMLAEQNGVIIASDEQDRFLKSMGVLSVDEKNQISQSNKFFGKEIASIQYEEVQKIIRSDKKFEIVKMYDAIDKEEEILTVNKVDSLPFYLVIEIGLADVENTVIYTSIVITLLIVFGLILMSLLIYRSFVFIIKPIDELKEFSEKISSGNFSDRIEIKTNDELSDLANSFNTMTANLAEMYSKLDEKVKERTLQLEKSEEIMKKALSESERLNKLMVGRELEMIEMKKELNALKNNK